MLRLEYDIQHHLVLSRRNLADHALIRMIVSTLSVPSELFNLRKRDFRVLKGKRFEYYTVKLSGDGKSRISPVDKRTFEIIQSLPAAPFKYSEEEMNSIVAKYSPPDKIYDCKKLRATVKSILNDAAFFGELDSIKDIEEKYAFMLDFNPLYSGSWDLEEYEEMEDFILNYSEVSGIKDSGKIAVNIGIDETIVREILKSGKNSLLSFSKERRFIL